MRRVHRTLMERFSYLAIYSCKDCHAEDNLPRAHQLHRGKAARCPKCGTFRLSRLKEPDRIDPMHTGLLNRLEKMAGGRLFHCRYCRIQFWDRRRLQSEIAAGEATVALETETVPETETAAANPDGPEA
jgi:DNA-directed RNA polymerase subunit RPC12/RpoP